MFSFSRWAPYLWTYWSHVSPALCTPGTGHKYHSKNGRSSPSRVILVSCTVLALRSACYKYTATGIPLTVVTLIGPRSCSRLEARMADQSRRLVVFVHAWKEFWGAKLIHVEPLSTICATRPNVTQGHQQVKQPAPSRRGWNTYCSETHVQEAWEVKSGEACIQVLTSPKHPKSPTDHSPDMLLIGRADCG
jgi:hypothetical protein